VRKLTRFTSEEKARAIVYIFANSPSDINEITPNQFSHRCILIYFWVTNYCSGHEIIIFAQTSGSCKVDSGIGNGSRFVPASGKGHDGAA